MLEKANTFAYADKSTELSGAYLSRLCHGFWDWYACVFISGVPGFSGSGHGTSRD